MLSGGFAAGKGALVGAGLSQLSATCAASVCAAGAVGSIVLIAPIHRAVLPSRVATPAGHVVSHHSPRRPQSRSAVPQRPAAARQRHRVVSLRRTRTPPAAAVRPRCRPPPGRRRSDGLRSPTDRAGAPSRCGRSSRRLRGSSESTACRPGARSPRGLSPATPQWQRRTAHAPATARGSGSRRAPPGQPRLSTRRRRAAATAPAQPVRPGAAGGRLRHNLRRTHRRRRLGWHRPRHPGRHRGLNPSFAVTQHGQASGHEHGTWVRPRAGSGSRTEYRRTSLQTVGLARQRRRGSAVRSGTVRDGLERAVTGSSSSEAARRVGWQRRRPAQSVGGSGSSSGAVRFRGTGGSGSGCRGVAGRVPGSSGGGSGPHSGGDGLRLRKRRWRSSAPAVRRLTVQGLRPSSGGGSGS